MSKNSIDYLIYFLSQLPGIGQRSARRLAIHLIENVDNILKPLSSTMDDVITEIVTCDNCGNIDTITPCNICSNAKRDGQTICVVETLSDLWAIERTKIYNGVYHILGGTLSGYGNIKPKDLNISNLLSRIKSSNIKEVVIATNATLDGQTTAFYIYEKLEELSIKVSKLGNGMPMGSELDYLDSGTLNAAFESRSSIGEKES